MKTFKKLAVAFMLVAGLGMGFASCSDDAYYEDPEAVQPLPPSVDLPMAPEVEVSPAS